MEEKPSEIATVAETVVVSDQTQPDFGMDKEHEASLTEEYHLENEIYREKNQNQGDDWEHYDPKDFEKFDNVEPQLQPEIIAQKVEQKVVIEQKPIKNFPQQKPQEKPVKKEQPTPIQIKPVKEKVQVKSEQKPIKVQQKPKETAEQKQQPVEKETKKKSKKKKVQQSEPLPVVVPNSSEGKKEIEAQRQIQQMRKAELINPPSESESPSKRPIPEPSQEMSRQQPSQSAPSQINPVSSIILPPAISAGEIIFQAQRQRIGTTLDLFFKFTAKHQKHISNQKQLIDNIEDQIEKRRTNKTPLMTTLRDYFDNFASLCKDLYERSYKFSKSEKQMNPNPMINMREELKAGIDEMIFLRKSVGNEYNRLGEFASTNISKNVIKLFTEYWNALCVAQTKQKQKREEFLRREKQFNKRINKVIKVYTKGKQGSSQEEDLFIEMIKFINQEKQFRNCLIDYGMGLLPLKKAFIKAEQTLYEELQVLFNTYKNQFRSLFSIHPKEFTQIEKMEKLIKENSTFQKLSDITDGDYVRSVLITLEKGSIQNLTDREFEKVLGMLHFEQIVGNPVQLLKGTTTKSFELKNKAEQVIDTVSGNLLIFNKQTAQMKEKFIIKNIDGRIVQDGVVEIDQTLKGIIFDSHRTVRITFRDNDRAQELICYLNQVHENIKQQQIANNNKK